MPRTTLAIETVVLRELKKRAAEEGRTLQSVVNDALRRGLAAPARTGYELRLTGWSGQLQPGVDLSDRDSLFEAMDGRR